MSTPSDRTGAEPTAEPVRAAASRVERKNERPSMRPGGPQSLVGVVLSGRYLIERLIGEGGMGAVYQAEHTHMRKRLAVKVLHPEMSRLPEVVARFEREAMAAAHIDHPNVAAATDFGKLDDGSFFLVLEYVEGISLRDAMAKGRLDLGRALHIARQMASALGRAHSMGIVHRDLKPENVMLITRDGEPDFVKVLDFGIAKVPVGELGGEARGPGQVLTQLGMVYGTPEYMAPEQALGQPVDARADLYGLGVILFEMISGARPYEHESKVTLLGMHVTAPIPHLRERVPEENVPVDVDALVSRLLGKEAGARFGDAKELIEALDAATAGLAAEGRIAENSLPTSLAHLPRASAPRIGTADGAGAGGSGATQVDVPARNRYAKGRLALTAITVGGVAVLAAIIVAVTPRGMADPSARGEAGTPSAAPPRTQESIQDGIVAAAQANIEKGDFATAIEGLAKVEKSSPARVDVHLLLERAFTGVRNPHDALREGALLLALEPNAAADLKLQEDIRNDALVKETQDDAFALLESKMGPRGIDILFDIAFGGSGRLYPQAAVRAKRTLSAEDVRARASPALSVVLDLREAKSCDAKHLLLGRAREQGDLRVLPMLQQYQTTRGCGFLGVADCFACMRKDALLADAVTAVQDRAAKPQ